MTAQGRIHRQPLTRPSTGKRAGAMYRAQAEDPAKRATSALQQIIF
jgi:hypothetical protein